MAEHRIMCRNCGELMVVEGSMVTIARAGQDHYLDAHYGTDWADISYTTVDRTVEELERMYSAKSYRPNKA